MTPIQWPRLRFTSSSSAGFNVIRDLRAKRLLWDNEERNQPMSVTQADLDKRFDYHKPGTQQVAIHHEAIRQSAKSLAAQIVDMVPEGREQSTALTKVEEAMMWANAGIARNQ